MQILVMDVNEFVQEITNLATQNTCWCHFLSKVSFSVVLIVHLMSHRCNFSFSFELNQSRSQFVYEIHLLKHIWQIVSIPNKVGGQAVLQSLLFSAASVYQSWY